MTTTRQFTQRRHGKLAKHTGSNDAMRVRQPRSIVPIPGIQKALRDVDGLQGREQVSPESEVIEAVSVRSLIETALFESIPQCRKNKDGSPNKQDLKREMRSRGWHVTREGNVDLSKTFVWGAL